MRLLLIRHGESWSNIDRIVSGERTCRGLTDRGHSQAEAIAEYLAAEQNMLDITAIYSTSVRRAMETAAPIARVLNVSVRPEFPHNRHGTAEGRPYRDFSGALSLSPDAPLAAGAESWAESAVRVGRMFDQLTRRHHGDTIVLTCHRETIIAAAQHFQRIPPTLIYATAEVDYTGITEWEHRPRSVDPRHYRWILLRHNDIRHLPSRLRAGMRSTPALTDSP